MIRRYWFYKKVKIETSSGRVSAIRVISKDIICVDDEFDGPSAMTFSDNMHKDISDYIPFDVEVVKK